LAIPVNAFLRTNISKTRAQRPIILQIIACVLLGVVLASATWIVAGFAFDLLGVR